MAAPRNGDLYRMEGVRLREKAAAAENDTALQNSYLALALEYDRLAETLDKRRSTGTAR